MFSGEDSGEQARKIWLVEKAPVVIEKLKGEMKKLDGFMMSQGLDCAPDAVANLKGDAARTVFIERFKEVQRLKTQLDQYTDLSEGDKTAIETVLPQDTLRGFRGVYLDIAEKLKKQQDKPTEKPDPNADQLDFEFVLFASALIDYDYIMKLLAEYLQKPETAKMTPAQVADVIQADAKFMDDGEAIIEYIDTLQVGAKLDEHALRAGFERFKAEKNAREVVEVAARHQLDAAALQSFVDEVLARMIFDGEALSDLMAPLELGWKERSRAESTLMNELAPILRRRAGERDISGLSAYEQ
jgi:type I restriction enzyme R subunit